MTKCVTAQKTEPPTVVLRYCEIHGKMTFTFRRETFFKPKIQSYETRNITKRQDVGGQFRETENRKYNQNINLKITRYES